MSEDHEICNLKVELANVKGELRAAAKALELARDNRHFMIGLIVMAALSTAALIISVFALWRG